MGGVRDRIERLCVALAELDLGEAAADAGAQPLLDRILTQVRSDRAPMTLEHDLDLLQEALARIGVDGLLNVTRYRRLPVSNGHPVVYAWLCPLDRCSRVETVRGANGEPVCGVADTPLKKVRLKT